MKRLLPLFFSMALLTAACNNNSKNNQGESAGDHHVLAIPDTIKVDAASNKDMMIILGILPDTIGKSFTWTRYQRLDMRHSVEKKGYFLDSLQMFKNLNVFKNNHIDLTIPDGKFLMTTYQISDGHYVILTVETIKGRQNVNAYELYKTSAASLELKELLGKYPLLFMTDATSQSCLGMLYDKSPNFEFLISDGDIVRINIKNYDKSEAKGCLKGNQLTLKFNKLQMPFDVESLTWEN